MRAKDILIIGVCLAIAGMFLTGAYLRQEPIRDARREMGLVLNEPLENAPPSLAFATVAMGAFRGLIVDILWMRADSLKQEGKFFDAKQLAEWITILQPRYAKVWDFHAWNMAYNISVAIPNTQCQERWRWVRNGIELLRDRGIELNPHDILLYRQLGWIFWHKVGDNLDDCHRYYKMELARSMRPLLGEKTNEEFEKMAFSSRTLEEMLNDPDAAVFVEALQRSDPVFEDRRTLVQNYLTLRQQPQRFSKAAFEVIDAFRGRSGLEKFDIFARADALRKVWKLDLDLVVRLNQEFGPIAWEDPNQRLPLNWEHPAVHAMYWAKKGLEVASRPAEYRIDEKNTDRIIFHSLQQLYRTGNLILYTTPEKQTTIFVRPDLRMFASCDRTWRQIIEKYEELEKGNPKGIRGGHKNFLENAVMSLYQSGRTAPAARLFQELRTLYPRDDYGQVRQEFQQPLDAFIRYRLKKEMEGLGIDDATEAIVLTLREAYFRYSMHEDDEAAGLEKTAMQIREYYTREIGGDVPDRLGLPSMDLLRYLALNDFWTDPQYPPILKENLMNRIQVERPDLYKKLQEEGENRMRQIQQSQGVSPGQ